MQTIEYQRWNPPQSPVCVEFPPQLPVELASSGNGEAQGVLFGMLQGGEIRVLAGRPEPWGMPARGGTRDSRLAGLNKIGIFVSRSGGEVFLSETDLERFQGQRAAVALVIAGNRAGFFVRQADGSIQSIRSHEEFVVEGIDPVPAGAVAVSVPVKDAPAHRSAHPVRRPKPRAASLAPRSSKAPSFRRAAAVLLAIPLAALAYLRPLPAPPAQLRLQQIGDAVAISWNRATEPRGARLEILDGERVTKIGVGREQSSLTYVPRSAGVRVRMTSGDTGAELGVAALKVAPASASGSAAGDADPAVLVQIMALEAEASDLRASVSGGHARVERLQKAIARLTRR